jgi:hypothetical protein
VENVQLDMLQVFPVIKTPYAESADRLDATPVFAQQAFFDQPVNVASDHAQVADGLFHIHVAQWGAAADRFPRRQETLHVQTAPAERERASTLADYAETYSMTVQILPGGGRTAAQPRRYGGCFHERPGRTGIRLPGLGFRSLAADFYVFRETQFGIIDIFPPSYSNECLFETINHGNVNSL